MPNDIVADAGPPMMQPDHWQVVWSDLGRLMSPTDAADELGLQRQTITKAIKRGEITPYQFSAGRVYVTPRIIAEWAENYCRVPQCAQLPS